MSSSAVNLEKYRIPLDEICVATKNFSSETRVGDGGFGVVHIGQLSEDRRKRTVAVKRLNRDGYQGNNEFYNELKMVSSFNHPNIIPFIGYCDDANEMIIVYEYAVNGSLDRHLQDPEKRSHIPWTQRLNICLGVARGLMYLHSGLGEEDRVIHRDVKSANILLDEKMEAKICDFGLSRFGPRNQPDTRLITKASGTRFYMDPIYNERGRLSKESDIYSFGVVMFEMSSGTLAYHARCFGDAKEQYLMDIVRCCYDDNELDDALDKLIDPTIRDHLDMSSFETFNKIAHECISFNLRKRPTMDRIIEGIKEALDMQEHPSHDHQVRGKSRNTNNQNNMRGSRTNKLSPGDQEGDNYISFGELKAIIQDMKVDQEGDNYISFGELKAIIQDMKFRKKFALEKENTIEEIMKEFDKDGDEKITMDEFVDRFTNWLDEAKHTDTHTLRSTSSWKDLYQVLKPWVESKTNEENTTEDVYWDDGPEDDQTLSRSNRCTWGDLLFSTWHFIKQVMGIFKHETIVAHEENQVNKKRGEPLSSGGVIDDRSNPPRQRDNSRKRLNKEDITQLLQELLDN